MLSGLSKLLDPRPYVPFEKLNGFGVLSITTEGVNSPCPTAEGIVPKRHLRQWLPVQLPYLRPRAANQLPLLRTPPDLLTGRRYRSPQRKPTNSHSPYRDIADSNNTFMERKIITVSSAPFYLKKWKRANLEIPKFISAVEKPAVSDWLS